MSQPHELGAREAASELAAGRLTSADLVEHLLARIAQREPTLHALIAVDPTAIAQARQSDERRRQGALRSPLDGVPIVVKDNVEVQGLPCSAGSLALADSPAQRDAVLVSRLRSAGLVVIASANLSEWANFRDPGSTSGWSALGGLVDNPWRSGRSAGGSSSGSAAALAGGYAPLAVGTETDGSITCPAALCGVVGLKPGVGLLPTAGIVPIAASQDAPGPMARTVADVAALLDVLRGRPVAGPPAGSARRFVLGAPSAWSTGDEAVDRMFAAAMDRAGAVGIHVRSVEVPGPGDAVADDEVAVLVHEMAEDLDAYLAGRPGSGPTSIAAVVAFNAAHADLELAHFGQEYLERALVSGGRVAPEYGRARAANLAWALDEVLHPALAQGVDALVAPSYGPAWPSDLGGGDAFSGGAVSTPAAIAGWPILTLPMGLVDGLPVGLSLVAPPGGEDTLLEVAERMGPVLDGAHPLPQP